MLQTEKHPALQLQSNFQDNTSSSLETQNIPPNTISEVEITPIIEVIPSEVIKQKQCQNENELRKWSSRRRPVIKKSCNKSISTQFEKLVERKECLLTALTEQFSKQNIWAE
nr:uncharacterized protein LOC111417276 [Onthophagus taurus]